MTEKFVPCSLRLSSVQQLPKGSAAGKPSAFSSALTPSLQAKISLPSTATVQSLRTFVTQTEASGLKVWPVFLVGGHGGLRGLQRCFHLLTPDVFAKEYLFLFTFSCH